jgi:hypothetical protein
MNTTLYEKGIEKGQQQLLRTLLERHFPQLSEHALARIQTLSGQQIVALIEKLPHARSVRDLGLDD